MNKVRPKLYLGNASDARNADTLRAVGVDIVLNVAIDLNPVEVPGITYANHGLIDGPGNTTEAFESAVLFLNSVVSEGKTVLVHCHVGMSRSPTVVAKHLSMKESREFDDCVEELKSIRPIVNPDINLIDLAKSTLASGRRDAL